MLILSPQPQSHPGSHKTLSNDPKRTQLLVASQRAVLVSVLLPEDRDFEPEPLEELRGLAKTAGVEILGSLIQNRNYTDKATLLGKGKVQELKALIEQLQPNVIIFDNNLSPGQLRNLEEELQVAIVDRNELILSIFATHARTHESQLQVELAQLLYLRPRLKRMWTHLERNEGAIGSRGPGEQQLETDRRLIDKRVTELRNRLKEVEKRRRLQVAQRREQVTVSLVGYTNAGKSTLMNALTGSDVYVADQLFATLDTRTKPWNLSQWGTVLLSDTVGFIRKLPHNLVASFRSTLEEARNANLLLHVVDASHPSAEHQINTVNAVLKDLGIDGSQAVLVLNKIDAVEDHSLLDVLRRIHPQAVSVSARQKTGFEQLAEIVGERLSQGYVEATVETGVGNGRLFAYLAQHAEVTDKTYTDSRVTIRCRIPQRFLVTMPVQDTHVDVYTNGEAVALETYRNGEE